MKMRCALLAASLAAPLWAQGPSTLQSLPPGTVSSRSISELSSTPGAQAMFADRDKRPSRTTSSGVRYVIYEDMPPEVVQQIDLEKRRMQAAETAKSLPDAVSLPPNIHLVGFSVDGAHITRIIRTSRGVELLLREWNFVKDGGSVLVVKEFTNTSVKGAPATFVAVHPRGQGKVQWQLGWTTDSRRFDLTMVSEDAGDQALATLLGIAQAL